MSCDPMGMQVLVLIDKNHNLVLASSETLALTFEVCSQHLMVLRALYSCEDGYLMTSNKNAGVGVD